MAEDSKAPLLANNYDDEGQTIRGKAPESSAGKPTELSVVYGVKDDFNKATTYIKELRPAMINIPFKGSSLVMTRDEKFFVFGSREGRLGIANRESRQVTLDKDMHQGAIYSMALVSNDQFILAGGASGTIVKLNYHDLKEVQEFKGHGDEINYLCVSKDEHFMYSASDDQTVRQWDLNAGEQAESKVLFNHKRAVYCVDVSIDGKFVASGSADGTAKVYSLETNQVLCHLKDATSMVWCVKISTLKKFVAGGSEDKNIYIWEFNTWNLIRTLKGHTARVRNLDVAINDDFLVSAGLDNTIKIWDMKGFRKETTLKGHKDWVKYALLSKSQDHIFSCSDDCTVSSWKIPPFESKLTFPHVHQFTRLDSFNNLAYCRAESSIKALSLNNGHQEFEIDFSGLEVYYYSFSSAGDQLFVFSSDGNNHKVLVYNALNGALLSNKSFSTEDAVHSVLILPNDKWIVLGHDIRVGLYDIDTLTAVHIFRSHKSRVTSFASTTDSVTLIARDTSNLVKMFDLTKKQETFIIQAEEKVNFMDISLDNEYLFLVYEGGNVEVFSTKRRTVVKKFGEFYSDKMFFTADKRSIAYNSSNEIIFRDLRNFCIITKLHFKERVQSFCISQNEEKLMFTSGLTSTIFPSPFLCKELTIYGDSERTYEFIEYICNVMQSKTQHIPEFDNWIIEPFHINAVHLYAHYNQVLLLKAAVLNHSPFYNSRTRHTPLEIAIEKRFMDCVESIYLGCKHRIENENDEHAFYYFGDSLNALNYSGYENLDEIYNLALLKSTDTSLPKFTLDTLELPLQLNSESPIVDPDEFGPETFSEEGTAVVFARTSFRISLNMGSQDSTDLLESLIACPNEAIYSTVLVQNILTGKWKRVRSFLAIQAFVFFIYLVLLCLYSTLYYESKIFFMLPLSLSCIMFIYEGLQMFYDGLEYLEDPWNYIDITRALLLFWYFFDFYFELGYYTREAFIILVLLSWLRGISYFSIIGKTRYLIKLIIEATIDIGSFFVILFYSTVAFALIYQSLHRYTNPDNLGFWDYFLNAFKLNLGELNTTEAQGILGWSLFVIVSIINPVIMLNLLISIMGDTYGRVKESRIVADSRQLAGMILEVEGVMGWKRQFNEKFYMKIVCEESYLSGIGETLNDNIQALSEKVKGMTESFEKIKSGIIQQIRNNRDQVLQEISY